MANQALYRRWRSQTFESVVGQEHVTITLRNALRDGRMSHAYLFTGPRGTGKTSTARILAKAINCLAEDPADRPDNTCRICRAISEGNLLDLIEIDAASNRGIDEIRDLREKINFRPNEARYKVYIIDEVHMLTKEAFNALLKTLEEPPAHAIFVLATTEPDRVPETVRSRCQRFDFRRISTTMIVEHLDEILREEGRGASPEALMAIARRSTGSMRDAISLLDQLLSYGDEMLSLERVEDVLGLVDAQVMGRLTDALAGNDTAAGLGLINQLVAEGVDLGQLVDQFLGYLRAVLFVQVVRNADTLDLPQDVLSTVARQASELPQSTLLAAIRSFLDARAGLREQVPGVPQLPVELAFLTAAAPAATGVSGAPAVFAAGPTIPPASATPVIAGPSAAPAVQTAPQVPVQAPGQKAEAPRGQPAADATPRPAQAGGGGESGNQSAGAAQPAGPATGAGEPGLLPAAQQNWDRFLALAGARHGKSLQAVLRGVRVLDVAGSTLILQFAHDFHRSMIDQAENRRKVEALWEEVLGRRVQVRCALAQSGPAAQSPAAAAGDGDEDPFLRDARGLGARVTRLE